MFASGFEFVDKLVSQLSCDIQTSSNGDWMLKVIRLDQIMGADGNHLLAILRPELGHILFDSRRPNTQILRCCCINQPELRRAFREVGGRVRR